VQKETDKADAISILARLEVALEEKINHIFELDRVLGQQILAVQQEMETEKTARDRIIQDLVGKLDAANRETGAAHQLAAGFARDLEQVRLQVQNTEANLANTNATLAAIRLELAATVMARDDRIREIADLQNTLSWRLTAPFRKIRRLFS
jgi:hypothetical protein